jgi:hypothetical protein
MDEALACFRLNFWIGFFRMLSIIPSRRVSFCVTTTLSSVVGPQEALED